MTREEFIKKAKESHSIKYDYSLIPNKIISKDKAKIICPEHGEFECRVDMFLRGYNCYQCSCKLRTKTTEEFIEKAQKIHGNKYDYSKVVYKNSSTKITIVCPEHGEFEQLPQNHLKEQGCPICAGKIKYTKEIFIEKAQKIHGNKYDYSKVICNNSSNKITIVCPEHGEFEQLLSSHLQGRGCPKCGRISLSKKQAITQQEFIERAQKIHGNKYNYSKTNYINMHNLITIICPEHGEFEQLPQNHLNGLNGCPYCAGKMMNTSIFIEKSCRIHKGKYDYSKVDYKLNTIPVTIICPEHGEFKQLPHNHLNGKGCPKCAFKNGASKLEKEVFEYIKSILNK